MIWPCTVVNENLTNEVICGDWLDYSPGRGRDVEWQCVVMWTVTRILYSWHTRVMTLSWRAPASPAVSQHHLLEHASLTNNAHHASHLEWKETTTSLPLHRPQSINIMRDTDLKNVIMYLYHCNIMHYFWVCFTLLSMNPCQMCVQSVPRP